MKRYLARQPVSVGALSRKLLKAVAGPAKAVTSRSLAASFKRLSLLSNLSGSYVTRSEHGNRSYSKSDLVSGDLELSMRGLVSTNRTSKLIDLNSISTIPTSNHKQSSNLYPSESSLAVNTSTFRPKLTRDLDFYPNLTPWITDSIIRMVESCSGKRAVVQHSMNVEHMVELHDKVSYRQ